MFPIVGIINNSGAEMNMYLHFQIICKSCLMLIIKIATNQSTLNALIAVCLILSESLRTHSVTMMTRALLTRSHVQCQLAPPPRVKSCVYPCFQMRPQGVCGVIEVHSSLLAWKSSFDVAGVWVRLSHGRLWRAAAGRREAASTEMCSTRDWRRILQAVEFRGASHPVIKQTWK